MKSSCHWIFGLQHKSTITLGLRSMRERKRDVLISDEKIRENKIEVIPVLRGGKTTIHSPGQLMIYPILNLKSLGFKLRDYVEFLLNLTIDFLNFYGIKGYRKGKTEGLYTQKGKIVFIGLRVHRGVSSYGLAINVSNDLASFLMIRNCGKDEETFSSMHCYSVSEELDKLFFHWSDLFSSALMRRKKMKYEKSMICKSKSSII